MQSKRGKRKSVGTVVASPVEFPLGFNYGDAYPYFVQMILGEYRHLPPNLLSDALVPRMHIARVTE